MSSIGDAKGQIMLKTAVDVTDDKDLKREGKVDQASGKAKIRIDGVCDTAKDLVTATDGYATRASFRAAVSPDGHVYKGQSSANRGTRCRTRTKPKDGSRKPPAT